jgi:histidinol-phosphate/aromatic aminotransferase/cobyric acid decarboxylase-like protein
MIITNTGNPTVIKENAIEIFKSLGYSPKGIFSGVVPQNFLDYQKIPQREFEEVVRFYYDKILNRPLTQTDYVIIGEGSLGAFNCATWAIQKLLHKTPMDPLRIYQINTPPTYTIFKDVMDTIPNCYFSYNTNIINEYSVKEPDVGLIISPNNPTGEIINERRGQFQIIDSVYDIPIFSNSNKSLNSKFSDNEIHIESVSKLGMASYRFGWAITSNPMIYSKAWEYKRMYNNGLNTSSLYMSKNFLDTMYTSGKFQKYSEINFKLFRSRRKELLRLFKSKGVREFVKKGYDKKSRRNVPYLFMPISQDKFKSIGIETRPGRDFFYTNDYSRINLMMASKDYKDMVGILSKDLDKLL